MIKLILNVIGFCYLVCLVNNVHIEWNFLNYEFDDKLRKYNYTNNNYKIKAEEIIPADKIKSNIENKYESVSEFVYFKERISPEVDKNKIKYVINLDLNDDDNKVESNVEQSQSLIKFSESSWCTWCLISKVSYTRKKRLRKPPDRFNLN